MVDARELPRERIETVEGVHIAKELRRETLHIGYGLSSSRRPRILRETQPRTTARALEIDCGNLAVGNGAHWATPKRACKLPSPVLCKVDTRSLTTMSG